MKSKKNTLFYIYIVLWVANVLQSIFINTSLSSLIVSVPLYSISLYCTYYVIVNFPGKPRYIKALSVFVIALLFYGLFRWIEGETLYAAGRLTDTKESFMSVISSLMPIFAFYYFTITGSLNRRIIRNVVIIISVVSILEYLNNRMMVLSRSTSMYEDIVNNRAYSILALLPFICFIQKETFLKYLYLFAIIVFVVSGMKRGAIVCCAIMLVAYYFVNIKKSGLRNKSVYFLGLIIVSIAVYGIFNHYLSSSDFFIYRFQSTLEGSDSGRSNIYETLWRHFTNEDNLLITLFGNGADGTLKVIGIHAHQDWLELLIDMGLLGVILYIVYWVNFYRVYRQSEYDINLSAMVLLCFTYTFLRSCFSMSYMDIPFAIDLCIGYSMARFTAGLPLLGEH